MSNRDDPGWKPVVPLIAFTVLPALAMRKSRSIDDRLVGLRLILVSEMVLYGLVTIVVAIGFTSTWEGVLSAAAAGAGVVIVSIGASVARARQAGRVPIGETGEELVDNYRARFSSQMVLINLLLGFAALGGILSHSPAPFLVGLAAGGINIALAAPTASRVAADQQLLASTGSVVDLTALLRSAGAEGFAPQKKKRR